MYNLLFPDKKENTNDRRAKRTLGAFPEAG